MQKQFALKKYGKQTTPFYDMEILISMHTGNYHLQTAFFSAKKNKQHENIPKRVSLFSNVRPGPLKCPFFK